MKGNKTNNIFDLSLESSMISFREKSASATTRREEEIKENYSKPMKLRKSCFVKEDSNRNYNNISNNNNNSSFPLDNFNESKLDLNATKAELSVLELEPNKINMSLANSEKNTASNFKKKELVLEHSMKMTPWEKASEKIGRYFHADLHKEKAIQDWRLNNDYKEHVAFKAIVLQLSGTTRSFFSLHKDYSQDSPWKAYFLVVDLCRQIIFSLLVVVFYDQPFIGMILINIVNVFYLVIFFLINPFKKNLDKVQNFINEVLLNVICFAVLYLASMEKFNTFDEDLQIQIGWLIVFANASLIVIFLGRMIFNLLKLSFFILNLLYKYIKTRIKRRNQVGNLDPRKKREQEKDDEGDLLQKIIEIENFLR